MPALELQELINLLAGPGVLAVLAELAHGPRPYPRLRATTARARGGSSLHTIVTRLRRRRLVYYHRTGTAPGHYQVSLTTAGHALLDPLAGLADWHHTATPDPDPDLGHAGPALRTDGTGAARQFAHRATHATGIPTRGPRPALRLVGQPG